MVKVEGLTKDEIALREKKSKLIEATKEFLGIHASRLSELDDLAPTFGLKHHSEFIDELPVLIDVSVNSVSVSHRSYFDEALSLAKRYEELTKEEFTLKQRYR